MFQNNNVGTTKYSLTCYSILLNVVLPQTRLLLSRSSIGILNVKAISMSFIDGVGDFDWKCPVLAALALG